MSAAPHTANFSTSAPTFHCYHGKLYPKSQSTYILYHWQVYCSVFFSLLTCSCLGLFCKSRFNFPHLKTTWAAYICFSSCLNSLLRELTMPLNWNAFTESLRTENFTLVENEGYEWLSLSFWSREAFYESWNIFTFPWLNRPSQIVSFVFSFLFSFCIIILRFMFLWENVWDVFTGMSQVLWHGVENNFNQPISWENVTISRVTVILYEFVQCH